MLIWFPNNYANYSVQTEDFRASIPEGTELYDAIALFVTDCGDYSFGMSVVVATGDSESTAIRFVKGNTYGSWEEIGKQETIGVKWIIDANKTEREMNKTEQSLTKTSKRKKKPVQTELMDDKSFEDSQIGA